MNWPPSDDYLLLTVTGPDGPGITYRLMETLRDCKAQVADLGQSVTYGILSLSVLVDRGPHPDLLEKNLDALAQDIEALGPTLRWRRIPRGEGGGVPREKFILICVGTENLSPSFIGDTAHVLASHGVNIHRIDNSGGGKNPRALEVTTALPPQLHHPDIKARLFEVSHRHRVDMALLRDDVYRRNKRLIVFDMDSTLIQTEVIDEMAQAHGVGPQVADLTRRAMAGEMDFETSLRERVAKLEGLEVEHMGRILEGLTYTPGLEAFIDRVQSLGYRTALISGGFSFFAEALKKRLHLDYAFANDLEVCHGRLTGHLRGQIVGASQKAFLLKFMAQMEHISPEQVVAIGDGANDLPMLASAGLGIAYHAKEVVRSKAQNHMSHGPMTSILYFLGIPLERGR